MILAWASISTAIIVSNCFNIVSMALSDLGDWTTACGSNTACLNSCNRLSEPIFNYGLIVSGILIAFASLGLYKYSKSYPLLLTLSGISLSLVGVLPERYGTTHFLAALFFFLLLPIAMLIYAKSTWNTNKKESLTTTILSIISFSGIILFIAIKTLKLNLGYAIPEIIGALPATTWLEIIFLEHLVGENKQFNGNET